MEKHIYVSWPESQKWMDNEDVYITEDCGCFVPEELIKENKEEE